MHASEVRERHLRSKIKQSLDCEINVASADI